MKVLAFSDVALPDGSGGVERQIFEIYGRLIAEHGADVRLVALGGKGAPRYDLREGVVVRRARQLRLDRLTGAQATLSPLVWKLAWDEARRFRPDVIHANTLFYATTLAATAVAWLTRTPLVVTAHIGHLDALPQPYRALSKIYEATLGRLVLSRAERVICIGEAVRNHILGLGVPAGKTCSIPNGVDSGIFHPRPGASRATPTVLSIGRLIFNKGNQYLIEAARQVYASGRTFQLAIVGEGPMQGVLVEQSRDLIDAGVVSFLGRRDDIPEILRTGDVFVRPSLTESMPMGVLEAMACGLPVVASNVGATAEIIEHGRDGVLVAPRSVPDLRDALIRLLDSSDLRAELGRAARERALAYDWERVASLTMAEFSRARAGGTVRL